ncbi:unnamed protein product [Psylliodes chrysocephalus]|uniref:UDP-glucuronosyltransferase n=1 Tax=Psylliodes chrysocephalus TaxID=3402493 RepID=A0A9P0CSW3_9CUCU|nr:unnamed protein product [Psylliodes chrysocephala]
MKLLFFIFGIFVSFGADVESSKILGICPAPAHSHFTLCFRLMKELADKGHEVSFVNSNPQKTPIKNLKDISVKETAGPISKLMGSFTNFGKLSYIQQLLYINNFGKAQTEIILQHKNIQDLMKSDEHFDLVILYHWLTDALAIFAHKFKCPLVILAPWPSSIFDNYMSGNPAPSSYVTYLSADYDSNMNFWQRIDNTFNQIVGELIVHFKMVPTQNEALKKAFPDAPELSTILYNTSLILTPFHPSLGDPIPLQQNIIEIGGYHVTPPKPLPKDLQDFMDSSTEGVVIFSMGSNVKSSDFTPEKIKTILNAFSKIKQKVLWKFEVDLPDKPANVKILSWLPQSDLIAHPNTVAFISHCGLLGTTEAVYHGVPILGLPVFWDQVKNIAVAVSKGYGLKVDFYDLDEQSFSSALQEIVNNPKYRNTAKERSRIMHDDPVKQLDKAVFWIEYVIRHKGAAHLRSPALNLRWYQLYLLDIISFVVVLVSIFITCLYLLCKCVCRKNNSVKSDKKNK